MVKRTTLSDLQMVPSINFTISSVCHGNVLLKLESYLTVCLGSIVVDICCPIVRCKNTTTIVAKFIEI